MSKHRLAAEQLTAAYHFGMDNWKRNLTFTVALPPPSLEALKERAAVLGVDLD
jgi:hypothetical protein